MPDVHPSPEDFFDRIIMQVLIAGKRQPALTMEAENSFCTGKINATAITGMWIEEIQQGG